MYATVKFVKFLEMLATPWCALKHLSAYRSTEVAKMYAGIKPIGKKKLQLLMCLSLRNSALSR